MATLRDIKRKINSVRSTQTITRTMKMVSASKLRRAQEGLENFRAYAVNIEELAKKAIAAADRDEHLLLKEKEDQKRVLIFSIGSDRGLCGGFNVNIALHTENFIAQNKDIYERISAYIIGRKVRDHLARRRVDVIKSWVDVKRIEQEMIDEIASDLISFYINGEFDKIYLVYTDFISPVRHVVRFEEFIPLIAAPVTEGSEYLYEPEKEAVIEALIQKYINTKIYYAILDSQTSEHSARMNSMENATNNCSEMMSQLTLVYNKRRQEGITTEMMDIVGGAEALRGR